MISLPAMRMSPLGPLRNLVRCGYSVESAALDPKIDAVDWVERIPFAETRNYVARVMENLQVYRKRFGDVIATTEPNLHRAATVEPRAVPTAVELSVPR